MGCAPVKRNEQKSIEKSEKKGKNFDAVMEDIMDIKTVQIKGEMLFSETQGKPKEHYEFLEILSQNSIAIVRKVKNRFSGCIRSMKIIKKAFIDLQEDEKNFMKEIAILRTLDHLNILKIYEFYQDEKSFYLITECYKDGDIFEKIIKNGAFTEYGAAYVVYQVLSALLYCHTSFIVHRDIKAENLLIESTETAFVEGKEIELYNIRLCDFSSARSFNKSNKLTKKVGTPYYIAPEVLKRSYNEKCDVWSVGVLLFILLCGRPPFYGDTDKDIISHVETTKYDKREDEWKHISTEGQQLVDAMLRPDYNKRLSIQDSIKHPWFSKYLIKKKLSDDKMNEFYRSMISFKTDPKYFFQQACIAYMVHHITTREDIDDIRKFFAYIDNNGDGKMSYSEIIDGMKMYINIENEKHLMRVFKFIDQGKAGYIEFEEFVRSCINKHTLMTKENLRTTFLLFTKEEGKSIEVQDFKTVLGLSSKMSEKAWEQIIKQIDVNGDGNIDQDEFVDMMLKFLEDD